MNLALVHDDLIQYGGAERVFGAMCEMWPEADVFTSMVSENWKLEIRNWKLKADSPESESEGKESGFSESDSRLRQETDSSCQETDSKTAKLITSFMQHLPFKKQLYRYYFPLYPLAFESFDLSDYDVVFSSSTRFAHGVITKPETKHICYMHSPGRMWWEPRGYFSGVEMRLIASLLSWLRMWDYTAAQRVDHFIVNSKSVQAKIRKYYNREAEVIYPFVELERFSTRYRDTEIPKQEVTVPKLSSCPTAKLSNCQTDYYLIVSRLTLWKRIDLVIEACNQLQLPLLIVGDGPDRKRLEKMAASTVRFAGRLSGEGVVDSYQSARALIFPQREDFGITPLEAMAAGKPVLAYRAGGALETVLPGETGEFFYPQTAEALAKALSNFKPEKYNPAVCRKQAERFSKERFEKSIQQFVSGVGVNC